MNEHFWYCSHTLLPARCKELRKDMSRVCGATEDIRFVSRSFHQYFVGLDLQYYFSPPFSFLPPLLLVLAEVGRLKLRNIQYNKRKRERRGRGAGKIMQFHLYNNTVYLNNHIVLSTIRQYNKNTHPTAGVAATSAIYPELKKTRRATAGKRAPSPPTARKYYS